MKRDGIIQMAHEAADATGALVPTEWNETFLKTFANLVAAAERVAIMHMTTKAHAVDDHCDIVLAADIRARSTP